MSKTCPSCNREVENEIVFCNFCGAFAGNEPVKADDAKVVTPKNIIIAVSVLIVLSAIMLFVFVFDIFGLKKAGGAEHIGKGRPLFSMGLTPVSVQGKWGYADKEGNMVIEPIFENAFPFADKVNGLALVGSVEDEEFEIILYGYIDEKGEYKIEPTFTDAESFTSSGYAKINGSCVPSSGSVSYEDYPVYNLISEANYINGSGKAILNRKYSFVSDFTDTGYSYAVFDANLSDGAVPDVSPEEKAYYYQNKYYIIGRDLKEKYSFSDSRDEGIADVFDHYFVYFRYGEEHKTEVISSREFALASYEGGKPVTDFYDRIYNSNNFYILTTFDEESYLYKAEIYDKDLNLLSDGYYVDSSFEVYDSGLILYKKSGTRYVRVLLNDDLKEVCEENAEIKIISGFDKSGIACVKEKDGYAGYNAEGKVFTCQHPFGKMNCGLAPFLADDGRIGYININGETVLSAEYIAVSEFSADGYATVFKNGYYKIIDNTGKVIIDGLDYPINLVYGNNLDLKWYGNKSFGDNIKLMFDDGVISASGKAYDYRNGIYDVFGRNYAYNLYNKEGTLIGSENSIVSAYNSQSLGGALLAEYVTEDDLDEYRYSVIDSNGNVKMLDSTTPIGVPDEYGIIIEEHYFTKDLSICMYAPQQNKSGSRHYHGDYVQSDNGHYITGYHSTADIYDNKLKLITVLPTGGERVVIKNGKVKYSLAKSEYFSWIPVSEYNPPSGTYVTDYYNGRTIIDIYSSADFTENGFILAKDGNGYKALFSPDGLLIYENSLLDTDYPAYQDYEIADATYPGVVLVKNITEDVYFYVDRFGNKSEDLGYATPFGADGYAVVRKSDGDYYSIDTYFGKVAEFKYQPMGFTNGVAPFYDEESGYIGFIDITGQTVIEPKFHAVSDFSYDGYAVAKDEDGNAFIIDKKGETVIATDGFEGAEAVKRINDEELKVYSRYCFENGYKYYLSLSWEEEQHKLFRYGLAVIGERDNRYLVDEYGNTVYGPYGGSVNEIKVLPDGTPYFITDKGILGIDGKPIDYLKDYSSAYTDGYGRIIAVRDKHYILDKNGNVISDPELKDIQSIRYGYLVCTLGFDVDGYYQTETVYMDSSNNTFELECNTSGVICGNDLVRYRKGYSLSSNDYELQSISSGEVVLEYALDEDSSMSVVGDDKYSCIIISDKEKITIYSYSRDEGLTTICDDITEMLPQVDERKYRIIQLEIASDKKTAYGTIRYTQPNINHDDTVYGAHGILVCDLEKNTIKIAEGYDVLDDKMVNNKLYWRVTGFYNASKYYLLDEEFEVHTYDFPYLSVLDVPYHAVVKDYYNGFRIRGKSINIYYYEREDGEVSIDYLNCTSFCSDGYAIAELLNPESDREFGAYQIIDKHLNVVYNG